MLFNRYNNPGGFFTGQPVTGKVKVGDAPGYYVWKTKGDGKVRSAHSERDRKVFRWDDPPSGGHPGQDFNCRCKAVQLTPSMLIMADLKSQIPSVDSLKAQQLQPRERESDKILKSFIQEIDGKIVKARQEWVQVANKALETVKAREETAYIKELEEAGLSVPDYLRERAKRPTRDKIKLASPKETKKITERQVEEDGIVFIDQRRTRGKPTSSEIDDEKALEHIIIRRYNLQDHDRSKLEVAIDKLIGFGKTLFGVAVDTLFFPPMSLINPEAFMSLDKIIKGIQGKYIDYGETFGEYGEKNPYYNPPFTKKPLNQR